MPVTQVLPDGPYTVGAGTPGQDMADVVAFLGQKGNATDAEKGVTPYAANTTYAANQLVVYLGALYLRKTAGTSGATFTLAEWTVLTSAQSVDSGVTPPDAPGVTYIIASTAPAPAVPGAPTALTFGTATSSTQPLSWTAPASAGGSAITDYFVEYKLASEPTTWTLFSDAVSTTTSTTVTGLIASTSYNYRVTAVNAQGNSVPSATATGSTPAATVSAFTDTFERADGPVGNGWTGINAANGATVTDGANILTGRVKNSGVHTVCRIVRNCGANGDITITGYAGTDGVGTAAYEHPYIIFRYVDNANFMFTSSDRIYSVVAGVETNLGGAVSNPSGTSPWTTRVTFNGTLIEVYSDGVKQASATSNINQTAIKCGLTLRQFVGEAAGDFAFTPL